MIFLVIGIFVVCIIGLIIIAYTTHSKLPNSLKFCINGTVCIMLCIGVFIGIGLYYNHVAVIEHQQHQKEIKKQVDLFYQKNNDKHIYYNEKFIITMKDNKYEIYGKDKFNKLTDIELKKQLFEKYGIYYDALDLREHLLKPGSEDNTFIKYIRGNDINTNYPFLSEENKSVSLKDNLSLQKFVNEKAKDLRNNHKNCEIYANTNNIIVMRDKEPNENTTTYDLDNSDKFLVGDKIYEFYYIYKIDDKNYNLDKVIRLDIDLELHNLKTHSPFKNMGNYEVTDDIIAHDLEKYVVEFMEKVDS